jgi:hypothetical protein
MANIALLQALILDIENRLALLEKGNILFRRCQLFFADQVVCIGLR